MAHSRIVTGTRALLAVATVAVADASGAWDAVASPSLTPGEASGPLFSAGDSGRAVLHADGLTPGAERSGSLTIVNQGDDSTITLRAQVRDSAGPLGGRLSDELLFQIRSATAGPEPGPLVWSGRLADGAVVAELPFAAGAARAFRLTAKLPRTAGDDTQGAQTWFELSWGR